MTADNPDSTGGSINELSSSDLMSLEDAYGAHNYHPMPVVISRASGVHMWNVEGKQYLDFLSAYSAVNQGHCHPKIIQTMTEQATKLTLTSRAFYNDQLGMAEKFLCDTFKYDKCLMMNSGAEAVETAVKLARRWGYDKKKIPADRAVIVTAADNFHGRTSTIVSFSTDPECYRGFGPKMPGFITVPFNDIPALEAQLKAHRAEVCGFLVEPIQGEAGAVIPDAGYIRDAAALCKQYNCLLICDEIQSGLGRAGSLLASYGPEGSIDSPGAVRPDVVCLGKALSGGVMPVSCVLADDDIMLCIRPGQHGSTFGGSAIACAIVRTAVNVLFEEKLIENSVKMGKRMFEGLTKIQQKYPEIITQVRGQGLMLAAVIAPKGTAESKKGAWELCLEMMDRGLLAKTTHENTIRFSPPLVINEEQVDLAISIIEQAIEAY